MTAETSRLDRLEALTETILLAIQQLVTQQQQLAIQQQQLVTNQQAIQADLRINIADVVSMVGSLAEQADRDRAIIREMQSEVRGLQTENRRIWETLQRDDRP